VPKDIKIKASGLERVTTRAHDEDTFILILEDTKGKSTGYLLGPEGLNVILAPLLQYAATWAEKPDLAIETLTGTRHAMLAKRIELVQGRTPQECAVRIFLNERMEMTFLMPLEAVVKGTANLARLLGLVPPEEKPSAH
jgi:hypothetical protein